MPYTVKEVADMAGVSVRALHHYHQIGLLTPASVNEAGYRLYSEANLERLQQVLFFRELGINDRFYPCTLETFRGLGDLYVNDERFKAQYERVRPGLAEFMRAAMHLYCDRQAGNENKS